MQRLVFVATIIAAFSAHAGPEEEVVRLDTYEIHQQPGAPVALLHYHNVLPANSSMPPYELRGDGFVLRLHMQVGGPESSAETVTVIALTEGWIAEPETITVEDGDSGYIEIRRQDFLGL